MKKLFICLMALSVSVFVLSSCAATKRDCQGKKHYKQPGGFYM